MAKISPAEIEDALNEKILLEENEENLPDRIDYFNIDDEEFEYTSNEDIERIRIYEASTEMIGWIDSIDAPKQVGQNGNIVFKFFINNALGHRIQVITWNEEIKRIKDHILLNHIIHIDGAMPVPSKEGFQFGTLPFELTVRSNTMINILGKHKSEVNIDKDVIPLVSLTDAVETTGIIKIHGYIKSNFLWMKKYKAGMGEYGVGSVTDGVHKLEIRFTSLPKFHEYEKGDKVEVVGRIRSNSQPIFMSVGSLDDIKRIIGQRMPFIQLLKGTEVLKRKRVGNTSTPTTSDSSTSTNSKKKKNE